MALMKVIGVAEKANDDGSYSILVSHEEQQTEVIIPLPQLQELIRAFQLAAVDRAAKEVQNVSLPILALHAVQTAHKGPECELMVSSDRLGVLILHASDSLLRAMKNEIDKVLLHRGGSTARN